MEKLLNKISLQTYSLQGQIKGFEEIMKASAKAGYKSVEFTPPEDKTAEEIKAILDKYGLETVALHIGIEKLKPSPKKYADIAKVLGTDTIVVPCGMIKGIFIKTRKECVKFAKTVNKVAEKLDSYGIKTVFHNHDAEFKRDKVTDERLLDVLLEGFGPKVTLELDVFWAKYAGIDPLDAINQYKNLITHVHLKDLKTDPETGEKTCVDLTDGSLDFRKIIETLGPDVEYIVEVENDDMDGFQMVKRAYEELDAMAVAPINVAVIGLGYIGMDHLDAYTRDPNARVVAVCDSDSEWLRNVKIRYDIPEIYTDYHELLANRDIQAVSVCTPNKTHAEITIAALEAGLDVLVEKPMALSALDGRLMAETAKRTGKNLMVVQNQRFLPVVRKLKELYSSGKLGDAYYVKAGWERPVNLIPSPESTRPNGDSVDRNWYNDRAGGGGVLRDLGVHLLDSIMYITGFPKATEVLGAGCRSFKPTGAGAAAGDYNYTSEDFSNCMIKFDNGMSLSLEVSFGSPVSREVKYTEFYCTGGGAKRIDNCLNLISIEADGSCSERAADLSDMPRFLNINREFISALIHGDKMPVSPDEAVQVLEILDRLYDSIGKIDTSAVTEE